jgi:hypothetical protein
MRGPEPFCKCGKCPLCKQRERSRRSYQRRKEGVQGPSKTPPSCLCGKCRVCLGRLAVRKWKEGRRLLYGRMWELWKQGEKYRRNGGG